MRPSIPKEPKDYISLPDYAKQLGISHVAAFKRVQKGLIPARKIGRNYVVLVPGKGEPSGKAAVPYISIPQLAAKLGISRVAVFQRIKRQEINAWKVGRNYVIPAESYEITPQPKPKELLISVKKFMTIPHLAKQMGISRSTVYRKVKSGIIGADKIGRNFAVRAQEIYSDMSNQPSAKEPLPADYASTPQTAKQMGISRFALYRRLKKGGVKALVIGRNFALLKKEAGKDPDRPQEKRKRKKQEPNR